MRTFRSILFLSLTFSFFSLVSFFSVDAMKRRGNRGEERSIGNMVTKFYNLGMSEEDALTVALKASADMKKRIPTTRTRKRPSAPTRRYSYVPTPRSCYGLDYLGSKVPSAPTMDSHESYEECPICLEPFNSKDFEFEKVCILACRHVLCGVCEVAFKKCPDCKREINQRNIKRTYAKNIRFMDYRPKYKVSEKTKRKLMRLKREERLAYILDHVKNAIKDGQRNIYCYLEFESAEEQPSSLSALKRERERIADTLSEKIISKRTEERIFAAILNESNNDARRLKTIRDRLNNTPLSAQRAEEREIERLKRKLRDLEAKIDRLERQQRRDYRY